MATVDTRDTLIDTDLFFNGSVTNDSDTTVATTGTDIGTITFDATNVEPLGEADFITTTDGTGIITISDSDSRDISLAGGGGFTFTEPTTDINIYNSHGEDLLIKSNRGNLYVDAKNKTAIICRKDGEWKAYKIKNLVLDLIGGRGHIKELKMKIDRRKVLIERCKKIAIWGNSTIIGGTTNTVSITDAFVSFGTASQPLIFDVEKNSISFESAEGNTYIDYENKIAHVYNGIYWFEYLINEIELELYTELTISDLKKQSQERELLTERYQESESDWLFTSGNVGIGGGFYNNIGNLTIDTNNWTVDNGTGIIEWNRPTTNQNNATALDTGISSRGYNDVNFTVTNSSAQELLTIRDDGAMKMSSGGNVKIS